MSNTNELFSLSDFLKANPKKNLGVSDYLHAVFKLGSLPIDVFLSFVRFFWPKYKIIDGRLYLSDSFESTKYSEYLADNKNMDEIQFWLNLTEVTSIFEGVEFDDAKEAAVILAQIWNEKIRSEMGDIKDSARVVFEESEGEVFVTIDRVG